MTRQKKERAINVRAPGDNTLHVVVECQTPHEMLEKLKDLYASSILVNQVSLLTSLLTLRYAKDRIMASGHPRSLPRREATI